MADQVRTTQTNGNAKNKINGSRLRVWAGEEIIDEFVVPTYDAKSYCLKHPTGQYGKRYTQALEDANSSL